MVRNVSFDDFCKATSDQISKAANPNFAAELWNAWAEKDLNKMKEIYVKYNLDPSVDYPPNNGAWGLTERRTSLSEDLVLDRYQQRPDLSGEYASPMNNLGEPFLLPERALRDNPVYYFKFRVKKGSDFGALEFGDAMPWFDKPGGAVQVKSSISFTELLDTKKIEIIEKKMFDSNTKTWITVQF